MSTFDGIVQEFPYISIDYFRKTPERPAPLACFLSHVHSDHLQGLESFRAPFIYCSAATRELLLRIEKYPHRMNFDKGILESRRLHYKHLSKLLRPIPLDTPTEIELTPRLSIRVTLLDANHCTGAVMFLIEGDGQAILYTGDIRAEPWWVNGLVRHPVLIPYTLGSKYLDKVYLDTTFARSSHVYRSFPSKAEGLAELLQKVTFYPADTTFYFRAWTFGYEDVWIALSALLNSKIHVDRYQIGLYRSLASTADTTAPALCGFELGNRFVPGCLSEDERVRIHSCEPGVPCSAIASQKSVYIIPIVNRTKDGSQIPEKGAGGGGGDLYQVHELELPDHTALERLEQLCLERIHDAQTLAQTRQMLSEAFQSRNKALSLDSLGMKDEEDIPLEKLVNILSRGHAHISPGEPTPPLPRPLLETDTPLPKVIHFPYSRHSSYTELCALIAAFKPRDIYPCTVDPLTWDESISIQTLFGHLCTGNTFVHDNHMREMLKTDEHLRSRKRARLHPPPSQTESSPSMQLDGSSFEQERNATQPSQSDSTAARGGLTQSSTSSAQLQIPIPSSMDTIDDTILQLNATTSMPEATSDDERTNRAHLRRAWHFLHDASAAQDSPVFQLAPLPASLATDDEEDHPDESKSEDEESHANPADIDPPAEIQPKPPSSNSASPRDKERDRQHECTESQPSQSLSVSSSAFASSQDYFNVEPSNRDALVDGGWRQSPHGRDDGDAVTPSLKQSASSRSRRRAAYLAARADDYDAWASVSFVSAGNNHTEKETEL